MEDCFVKEGIVEAINEGKIVVRFTLKSACADCHAKQSCSSLDVQDRVMEFLSPHSSRFTLGEQVSIQTTRQSMRKAVFLAFIFPIFLLVVCLALPFYSTVGTVSSYWITSVVVIAYYVVLYMLKNKLNRLVLVHVVKLNSVNQFN